MMKDVVPFLDAFFEAERRVLAAYMVPDLTTYNDAVDDISTYVVPQLKHAFGARLTALNDAAFYERVKNFAAPEKRFLFRIDEHETPEETTLYACYVSNYNPNGWMSYFGCLLVGSINNELKILATFNFSDRGMGNKKWFFAGGDRQYARSTNGENLLNRDALGRKVSIHRVLEPSNDADSMREFNVD